MQIHRRYELRQTLQWSRNYIIIFTLWSSVPVILYHFFEFNWIHLPWQPLSLIGIAVAFYLGFKNNSSYDRTWEARKIWGGIVNTSRSFTVMVRDFTDNKIAEVLVKRHIAWLWSMTFELRKVKPWEHNSRKNRKTRDYYHTAYSDDLYKELSHLICEEDLQYILTKKNKSATMVSLQSKCIRRLKDEGKINDFERLQLQELITEMYTLQGKAERIKNFPFPRQYASANFYFVVLFVALLPFGMLNVFSNLEHDYWIWFTIPFSVVSSWVFWLMEMIGDYSENPFEGLHNDVPISAMSRGIEIDLLEMLDQEDIPEPLNSDDYGIQV